MDPNNPSARTLLNDPGDPAGVVQVYQPIGLLASLQRGRTVHPARRGRDQFGQPDCNRADLGLVTVLQDGDLESSDSQQYPRCWAEHHI